MPRGILSLWRAAHGTLSVCRCTAQTFHAGFEDPVIVASTLFGVVHRGVRTLDQRFSVLPVIGKHADADGHVYTQIVLRYRVRRRQYCTDLFSMPCRILRVFDLGEHDHEFIPSMTTHGVRLTNGLLKALSQHLQHFVAYAMP